MSWSVVIILLLVFAMMVGPIMMLKPSRRQQQLAKLRQEAAQLGLSVELETLAGRSLAAYTMAWPREAQQKFSGEGWALDKLAYEHGIHFDGRWQWRDSRTAPAALHDGLREALRSLPASVQAVEATQIGLRSVWTEAGGSRELGVIVEWLKSHSRRFWPFMHLPQV
jgi:hypothetical protein